MRRAKRISVVGSLGLMFLVSLCLTAEAAEIKVIGSPGVAGVVTEFSRQFEDLTGHKIQAEFAVIAVSKRKIDAGATFDIAILGPAEIDELIGQGKIVANTRVPFGRTGIGVVVRKDKPHPDISSVEAFKKTMLLATSVGHSKEGLSGVAFMAALDRLGITPEMKPKLRVYEGAELAHAIANGDIELGVTGIGPILSMPGADFVGALPAQLQTYVIFTAGVSTTAKNPEATRSFLKFMTAPAATSVFTTKGMERD